MAKEWLKRTGKINRFFTDDADEDRRKFLVMVGVGAGAALLTACTVETLQALTEAAATPIKPSETPKPANTVRPSETFKPSDTPTPPEIPTATSTSSNTPTETLTSTPEELTLEQRYGNLVSNDERAICVEGIGNMFDDQTPELIQQYHSVRIGVRSTGVVSGSWRYIEEIDEEAYILKQEVVFRDGLGVLKKMDVETGLADRNNWPSIGTAIECDINNCGSVVGSFDNRGVGMYRVRPIEEALAYYCCQPGQRLLVEFAYERPDVCPEKKVGQDGTTNIANIVSYISWVGVKSEISSLGRQMMQKKEIDVPQGMVLPGQASFILMPIDKILEIYYRYADG